MRRPHPVVAIVWFIGCATAPTTGAEASVRELQWLLTALGSEPAAVIAQWPERLHRYPSTGRCSGTLQLDSRADLNLPCEVCSTFVFAREQSGDECNERLIDAAAMVPLGMKEEATTIAGALAGKLAVAFPNHQVLDEVSIDEGSGSPRGDEVLLRRWMHPPREGAIKFLEIGVRWHGARAVLRVHRADVRGDLE